jgi:hypothetical protein
MRISSTLMQAGGNFARPTKYNLILNLPNALHSEYGSTIDVMCKTTSVPSITNENYEVKIKGHPIRIPARTHQTQEINLSFYIDEYYNMRKIFQDWIYALDNRNPVARNQDTAIMVDNGNIYGNMELIGRDFAETLDKPISWIFEDVFPINISDINFDTTAKDTLSEFDVTLAYSRYLTITPNSMENIEDMDNDINQMRG